MDAAERVDRARHNKMEIFKTSGGVSDIQTLTVNKGLIVELMGSTLDGQPSIRDSDKMPVEISQWMVENASEIEQGDITYVRSPKSGDAVEQDDLTPLDLFEDVEFLEASENVEASSEKRAFDMTTSRSKKGTHVLKRPTAPEIRPIIKNKRFRAAQETNSKSSRKEELHALRMEILRDQLEVNDTRLIAGRLDVEIKEIQKNIEVRRLKNLLQQDFLTIIFNLLYY